MNGLNYYIEGENGLEGYHYDDIVKMVNSGMIDLNKKVLIYDPLDHHKKTIKAKELL